MSCIACGVVFGAGELRMATPIGELCVRDAVPAYRVRVGDTVHRVIGWTPEVLARINAQSTFTCPDCRQQFPRGSNSSRREVDGVMVDVCDDCATCTHGAPLSAPCASCAAECPCGCIEGGYPCELGTLGAGCGG